MDISNAANPNSIEVTAEMIEAGLAALHCELGYSLQLGDIEEGVRAAVHAALSASPNFKVCASSSAIATL